jgi:hypothetical protein
MNIYVNSGLNWKAMLFFISLHDVCIVTLKVKNEVCMLFVYIEFVILKIENEVCILFVLNL